MKFQITVMLIAYIIDLRNGLDYYMTNVLIKFSIIVLNIEY